MTTTKSDEWELVVRPRKVTRYATGVALVLVVTFVVVGVMLRSTTGVYFKVSDQISMVLLGLILAAAVMLLARPRLRVGASGVAVRNIIGERHIDWDLVLVMTLPEGATWARIEIPDDEFVPVMAIQVSDREYAVDAVRTFRSLQAKYSPWGPPGVGPA
ncbi:PH domain-containing protein [Rhodococcus sp. D2-41]|uniref:PH domain-containing protein n=1 Tax=Speluncibacter jeojiensis TaxID=2710754 RepID=A0A9X4M0R9_9ACTN|nr:PH domain-containing protein [Rhodococcus sp. D2-41]MDG3011239.1 PH domain-containing protein [Rhodococcus sp. D2-41]MDG3015909.1 PH domain-containing protein [Corynebacteriales bacterium D3-21]